MVKENIIIKHKTRIGLAEDLWMSLKSDDLKKDHPEIEFVLFERSSGRSDQPLFIIGSRIEDESALSVSPEIMEDPILFWDMKRRAMAYSWLESQSVTSLKDLYEVWYKLKFLCQEIRNPLARTLGREMADLKEDSTSDVLDEFKERILSILTLPSSSNRIRNSLWKNYSNQLKRTKNPLSEIKTTEDPTGDETLLQELKILENEARRTRLFFGTSPVIYENEPELP